MRRSRSEEQREQVEGLYWLGTERGPTRERASVVRLQTDRGEARCLYHPVLGAEHGVLWMGGAGGGLDGPARGIYPEVCRRLQDRGVAGLRLDYRHPGHLSECALDALLGLVFLQHEGIERAALVGHSFGGSVAIMVGALTTEAAAVVAMAAETTDAALASRIAPRPLLLVHGAADEVSPAACSRAAFRRARDPKMLVLYPGAGHSLYEARADLLGLLVAWLPVALRRGGRPTPQPTAPQFWA